jgi:alpha-tubulin suppressor-like RCC1 family protein
VSIGQGAAPARAASNPAAETQGRVGSSLLRRIERTALALLVLAALLAAVPASGYAEETGSTAVAWGENINFDLGIGWKSNWEESPQPVQLSGIKQIAGGYGDGFALLTNGTVEGWGGNTTYQLGDGTAVQKELPVPLPGLEHVKEIAVGGTHGLALLENGTVMAWGNNQEGERGNGELNPIERENPNPPHEMEKTMVGWAEKHPYATVVPGLEHVKEIAAGPGTDFAVVEGEKGPALVAWGRNDRDDLGVGKYEEGQCKTEVGFVKCVTKPEPVVLNGTSTPLEGVEQISAGGEAAYVIVEKGHIMAWGNNGKGAVGNDGTTAGKCPADCYEGAVHVLEASGEGTKEVTEATEVSGGNGHALARLANGEVLAWGSDDREQLGVEPATGRETCQSGIVCRTYGKPVLQAVGVPITGAEKATAGFTVSFAVKSGTIFAWGSNKWGGLGTGNQEVTVNFPEPAEVKLPAKVTEIDGAEQGTLALLEEGASGPAPAVQAVSPESKTLVLSWQGSPEKVKIQIKDLTLGEHNWEKLVQLTKPSEHEYRYRGLNSGSTYEILLSTTVNTVTKARYLKTTVKP